MRVSKHPCLLVAGVLILRNFWTTACPQGLQVWQPLLQAKSVQHVQPRCCWLAGQAEGLWRLGVPPSVSWLAALAAFLVGRSCVYQLIIFVRVGDGFTQSGLVSLQV